MNYYISDLHFGHANVITFDQRPFENVNEMDRFLIERWNAKVQKDDHVYILGDFAHKNENPEEWYLKKLKGHKHLVIGNHDEKLLKNPAAMSYFDEVDKMMHISDKGYQICACHFPICEWNGFYKGHLHLYGHIHNKRNDTYEIMKNRKGAYNTGCMIHFYEPVMLEELIQNNMIFQQEMS